MRRTLCKFAPVLAHEVHGSPKVQGGQRSAVWMHGIVGSKRNWKTCSKTFLAAHEAHFDQSVTVDHRGHGNSHGFKTPHTVAACSDDLTGLLASLQVCDNPGVGAMPGLLSGHSFGGKVALL